MSRSTPSSHYQNLVSGFLMLGLIGLGLSALHWVGIVRDGVNPTRLADALFNSGFAFLELICYLLLKQRRQIVIGVVGLGVVGSIAYSFAMGRGFNLIISLLGMIMLFALFSLCRHGELQ